MAKRVLLFFISLSLFCLFSACGGSKYDPERLILPENMQPHNETLNEEQLKLVDQIVRCSIDWYNSVDISEPQDLEFVDPQIMDITSTLFSYMDLHSDNPPLELIRALNPAANIGGRISEMMLEDNISMVIPFGGDGTSSVTMQIDPSRWQMIHDAIKDAIVFYYG